MRGPDGGLRSEVRHRVLPVGLATTAHHEQVAGRRREVVGGALARRIGVLRRARAQLPRTGGTEAQHRDDRVLEVSHVGVAVERLAVRDRRGTAARRTRRRSPRSGAGGHGWPRPGPGAGAACPCLAPTRSRRGSPRRVVVPEQPARPATPRCRAGARTPRRRRATSARTTSTQAPAPRSIRSTGASRSTQLRSSAIDPACRPDGASGRLRCWRAHQPLAPLPGGRHGHARPRDPRGHRRRRHRRAGAHRRRRHHRWRRHRGRARRRRGHARRSTPTARWSRRASSTSTRTTTARPPGTSSSRRAAGTASPPW